MRKVPKSGGIGFHVGHSLSLPNLALSNTPTSLQDLSVVNIARTLTLHDFELFRKVQPKELLKQAWQSEKKDKLAPNITAIISRFNLV
jgi:hypothetical protein